MITRAQAEALLTLAESLEACERVGLDARLSPTLGKFFIGGYSGALRVDAAQLRTAVADLMPKHTGS